MSKILILTPYFNRPLLVRKMLTSLIEADKHHKDWELNILDDNSLHPIEPIVEKMMVGYYDRIRTMNSGMTFKDKIDQGITLGKYANRAIRESNADIGILLSDDDELYPTYLKKLSAYFENFPETKYCYSKVHVFNPLYQKSKDVNSLDNKYNQWDQPINPAGKVDASQVAWRLSCCKEHGAWFKESTKLIDDMPWVKDTDISFFEQLYEKCGLAQPSDLIAQYKGIHEYQLLWHKKTDEIGLREYYEKINELGGAIF